MSVRSRMRGPALVGALGLLAVGCGGGGNVYVGVGVAGPWYGYPYPTGGVYVGGYPGRRWDEDAMADPAGSGERYAVAVDSTESAAWSEEREDGEGR